jgi:hypothetical protein
VLENRLIESAGTVDADDDYNSIPNWQKRHHHSLPPYRHLFFTANAWKITLVAGSIPALAQAR